MKVINLLLSLVISLLLVGCTTPSSNAVVNSSLSSRDEQTLDARLTALKQTGLGPVFKIEPSKSLVRIYAFRAGQGSRFGHNHVLSAPVFQAYFVSGVGRVGETNHVQPQFEVIFNLADLEIDNPAHRKTVGATFDSVIGASAIASTKENMLGEANF